MNKNLIWLAYHLLRRQKSFLTVSTWVSLAGLVLGVSSLVVSMAVVSGFESTLKRSVTDVTGHLQVLKYSSGFDAKENFVTRLKDIDSSVQNGVKFARIEGVLAHQGKIAGVSLQALDSQEAPRVLNLKDRLINGDLNIQGGDTPTAAIGKGIAKDFNLKVGDNFRIVVPMTHDYDPTKFKRSLATFKVAGVLDLGKHEFNQRMVIVELSTAQKLAELGQRHTGVLVRLDNVDKAREVGVKIQRALGADFYVVDWRELNENLFEAAKLERPIIFFVILIIVVAAAFNVASSLYINVVQKFSEIALLKAMGLSRKNLVRIFSVQGLVLGSLGCLAGILLGWLFCFGFVWLQNKFGVIPGSIYKIDHIEINIRAIDLFATVGCTLLICFVATLAPARRGSNLTTVEGLRHD